MNLNLKQLQIHAAGLTVVGVCLVSTYAFGIRPVLQAQEQLRQTELEVSRLQQLLPTLQSDIVSLNEQLATKYQQIKERYPLETQAGQPILGTISNLLSTRRISLSNLREEDYRTNGGVTLTMHTTSAYEDMLVFLHDLRRLDCPTRISQLTLTPNDEQGQRCTAKLTVHVLPAVNLPGAS